MDLVTGSGNFPDSVPAGIGGQSLGPKERGGRAPIKNRAVEWFDAPPVILKFNIFYFGIVAMYKLLLAWTPLAHCKIFHAPPLPAGIQRGCI